jgi:hypothetical protein
MPPAASSRSFRREHVNASTRVVPPHAAASKPSLADVLGELDAALRLRLRESPGLTLAVAGGIGYALGGGLTIGVLSRAVQLGLRFALTSRAEQMLADWVTMGYRTEGSREASNRKTGDRL